jgi:hypothetical protein
MCPASAVRPHRRGFGRVSASTMRWRAAGPALGRAVGPTEFRRSPRPSSWPPGPVARATAADPPISPVCAESGSVPADHAGRPTDTLSEAPPRPSPGPGRCWPRRPESPRNGGRSGPSYGSPARCVPRAPGPPGPLAAAVLPPFGAAADQAEPFDRVAGRSSRRRWPSAATADSAAAPTGLGASRCPIRPPPPPPSAPLPPATAAPARCPGALVEALSRGEQAPLARHHSGKAWLAARERAWPAAYRGPVPTGSGSTSCAADLDFGRSSPAVHRPGHARRAQRPGRPPGRGDGPRGLTCCAPAPGRGRRPTTVASRA